MRYHITYVGTISGWGGGMPTQEDRESFCALVVDRLRHWYPRHTVEAYIDEDRLESEIRTDDDSLDIVGLRATINNDVWADWCAGEDAVTDPVDPACGPA
jgi:hypothetical protein